MRNTFTIPQNIFIYGNSLGGSSFEQLIRLDTTIFSLFFKKKKKKIRRRRRRKKKERKKKERGDIHNQSINRWCLTHLSCISKRLYG